MTSSERYHCYYFIAEDKSMMIRVVALKPTTINYK